MYAYAFRVGDGGRSWHSKTLSLPLRKSHRHSSLSGSKTKQRWAIWAAQKLRPPVFLAHLLLCSNISFIQDTTFASLGRQSSSLMAKLFNSACRTRPRFPCQSIFLASICSESVFLLSVPKAIGWSGHLGFSERQPLV